jgi:hypothetical protein
MRGLTIIAIVAGAFASCLTMGQGPPHLPVTLDFAATIPVYAQIDHPPSLECIVDAPVYQGHQGSPRWAFAAQYGFSSRELSTGATANLGEWRNFLRKGWTVYIDAYAGIGTITKAPVGGFWAGPQWPIADNVSVGVAGTITVTNQRPADFGIGFKIAWYFDT